jgi:hypothetical protein
MLDLKSYAGVPLMHSGYRRVDADLLLVDCVRGLAGGGKALDREKPSVSVVRCSLILKVEFRWLPYEYPLKQVSVHITQLVVVILLQGLFDFENLLKLHKVFLAVQEFHGVIFVMIRIR